MPCQKCIHNPAYHSFTPFGDLAGAKLIYTAPAKTEDFNEDGTKLKNISIHVSEIGQPWIWVVDCANMSLKHYTEISFNIGVLNLLSADPLLKAVWVIRPNIWIKTTIAVMKGFSASPVLHGITFFDEVGLELYRDLKTVGVSPKSLQFILHQ